MAAAKAERTGEEGRRVGLLEAVMAEHETALLRYAGRILNDATAAQDVVQNVFIKLFRAWPPGMHPSAQLRSWLFRTTHNEAVDHVRRESRLRVLHEKQAATQTVAPDVPGGGALSEAERREQVLGHLRRLDPREQQVVLLRLDEGLSYEEIGAVTGRTVGNVGNILHHAVRKLAQAVRRSKAGGGA